MHELLRVDGFVGEFKRKAGVHALRRIAAFLGLRVAYVAGAAGFVARNAAAFWGVEIGLELSFSSGKGSGGVLRGGCAVCCAGADENDEQRYNFYHISIVPHAVSVGQVICWLILLHQ